MFYSDIFLTVIVNSIPFELRRGYKKSDVRNFAVGK